MNPYSVVKDFEQALCDYTGARYAVAVNSCTMALTLAVEWCLRSNGRDYREVVTSTGMHAMAWEKNIAVEIPKRTYVSVPMAIIRAGGWPKFRDEDWLGSYQLKPLPVWDSARRFSSKMYECISQCEAGATGQMVCVSFHASKILGDTQGGAILHDCPEADGWLRRARFDGRTEGVAPIDDTFTQIGWHCYMSNDVAARLLLKLYSLPKYNEDLPNDNYPDLSRFDIFK